MQLSVLLLCFRQLLVAVLACLHFFPWGQCPRMWNIMHTVDGLSLLGSLVNMLHVSPSFSLNSGIMLLFVTPFFYLLFPRPFSSSSSPGASSFLSGIFGRRFGGSSIENMPFVTLLIIESNCTKMTWPY
jgi:hypothetical protein